MYFEMKFSLPSEGGPVGPVQNLNNLAHGKEVLLDIQKITSDQ